MALRKAPAVAAKRFQAARFAVRVCATLKMWMLCRGVDREREEGKNIESDTETGSDIGTDTETQTQTEVCMRACVLMM